MFNHNFIHKFQPRANGARAVVEAVDMDAFASALRGSFARGDWSGAERSKTKRGCVNAGLLQSIGAVRARGEFDTEVASTGVEFERAQNESSRFPRRVDFLRFRSLGARFARRRRLALLSGDGCLEHE